MATDEASGMELLDCARYGELEDVEALLKAGVSVNFTDADGNTALHRAAANNHVDTVRALVTHGAKHVANKSGNTPLHWATQNKATDTVKLLLTLFPDIDVLQRNAFGQGCVSDAFNAENPDVLQLLLTHKSAKKLEDEGGSVVEANADEDDDDLKAEVEAAVQQQQQGAGKSSTTTSTADAKPKAAAIDAAAAAPAKKETRQAEESKIVQTKTHKFVFAPEGAHVAVREVASDWQGAVFGTTAREDFTGMHVWAAGLIASRWFLEHASLFDGKSVLELGAGCGLPGLAVYRYTKAQKVLLTDFFKHTVDNLKHNVDLNLQLEGSAENSRELAVAQVDWKTAATFPQPAHSFDVVLGCDLVYDAKLVPALVSVIKHGLHPDGTMLYVFGDSRDGATDFIDAMGKAGFKCDMTSPAPDEYKRNPLLDGDDAELRLHFNELEDNTFSLATFKIDKAQEKRRAEIEAVVRQHNEAKAASAAAVAGNSENDAAKSS